MLTILSTRTVADYLKAWWNVVNWEEINKRFEQATKLFKKKGSGSGSGGNRRSDRYVGVKPRLQNQKNKYARCHYFNSTLLGVGSRSTDTFL